MVVASYSGAGSGTEQNRRRCQHAKPCPSALSADGIDLIAIAPGRLTQYFGDRVRITDCSSPAQFDIRLCLAARLVTAPSVCAILACGQVRQRLQKGRFHMVGKPGGQPPSAAKAFKSAASGKPRQTTKTAKSTGQSANMMNPSPGGTSGGWSPPLGAKAAADRKQFAQHLANAKAKAKAASPAKPALTKPKTTSLAFNAKANSARAKTSFNSTAPKGQTRAAFNTASKSGGKGGRSR